MKRTLLTLAAAASLSACSSVELPGGLFGRDRAEPAPTAPPSPPSEAYLRAAGESDLFEVTSSQLALQRTQNPEIRRFATQMIAHHTGTTDTLLSAARSAGVAPPPAVLGPDKRAMIDALNAQAGHAFDRLYAFQQAVAHQQALSLHSGYAAGGDTPELRRAAGGAVKIVQRHLEDAQDLQARLGGQPAR